MAHAFVLGHPFVLGLGALSLYLVPSGNRNTIEFRPSPSFLQPTSKPKGIADGRIPNPVGRSRCRRSAPLSWTRHHQANTPPPFSILPLLAAFSLLPNNGHFLKRLLGIPQGKDIYTSPNPNARTSGAEIGICTLYLETKPAAPFASIKMSKLKSSRGAACLRHEVQLSSSIKLSRKPAGRSTSPLALLDVTEVWSLWTNKHPGGTKQRRSSTKRGHGTAATQPHHFFDFFPRLAPALLGLRFAPEASSEPESDRPGTPRSIMKTCTRQKNC